MITRPRVNLMDCCFYLSRWSVSSVWWLFVQLVWFMLSVLLVFTVWFWLYNVACFCFHISRSISGFHILHDFQCTWFCFCTPMSIWLKDWVFKFIKNAYSLVWTISFDECYLIYLNKWIPWNTILMFLNLACIKSRI